MGILFSALLNAEQYDSLTDTRLESDKNHNSVVLVKDKKKKNNSASYKENFLEALNKADYDEVITEISEKGVLNREAGIPSHSLMAKPGDIPRIQLYKKVKYKDKLGITLSKIKERKKIPRLDIGREEKISSRNFSVKGLLIGNLKFKIDRKHKVSSPFTKRGIASLNTLNSKKWIKQTRKIKNIKLRQFTELSLKAEVDAISFPEANSADVQTIAVKPLNQTEIDMLSSLLLVHKKEACPGAMPLLQTMLKVKEYKAEAAFHLASCANETGSKTLMYHYITQIIKAGDLKYIQKSLDFVQAKLPYDMVETFGRSLHKFVEKEGVDWIVSNSLRDKVTILLSRYGVQSGLYKTALKYSSMVSNDSPLYNQAKFIEGMSLYVLGNQKKSLQVQESLYKSLKKSGSDEEFKSLAAINLARVQFQSGMYHEAINNFKNVSKKHPLWLNSLIERAWSQLLKKDYGGAVGNMYSVQSAFFDDAYKPESHVIKTIGYLRLCQYGDAYNSLKTLNNTYMPWLKKVKNYTDKNKDSRTYYNTVRKYLTSNKDTEIDGLPFPVVLEMTRHGGFIELQKSINRNLDEKDKLASIAGGIDTNRLKYQEFISKNSSNIKKYEIQKIKVSKKIPDSPKILGLEREIDKELYNKDVNQFVLKIHEKNRSLTPSLVSFFSKGMTNTISVFQGKAEKTLHKNLVSIKKDLQKVLTNNEFLKYEVFSGGGENLRFLISGGKSKGRAPASVVTEKQMKWNDNKEVWMDEIGNYKSSLKSNCPKN